MRILTDELARKWLEDRGIQTSDTRRLSFNVGKTQTVLSLRAPTTREAITALPVNIVGVLSSAVDEQSGWLLWLRDFDIWSEQTEEIGWKLVDSLAESSHQPGLNLNSSALLFEPDETISLKAALLVPILFQWDAYLISGDGTTFVTIDHDDHSLLSTSSDAVLREIRGSQLESMIKT